MIWILKFQIRHWVTKSTKTRIVSSLVFKQVLQMLWKCRPCKNAIKHQSEHMESNVPLPSRPK